MTTEAVHYSSFSCQKLNSSQFVCAVSTWIELQIFVTNTKLQCDMAGSTDQCFTDSGSEVK